MHKGNGSRVWNISCLKNESGYFIERKASFFVQQIHFFPTQEILTLKNMLNVEMFLKNVKKQLMISVIWMYLLNVREKKGMQERYLLVSSAVQPWIEGHSFLYFMSNIGWAFGKGKLEIRWRQMKTGYNGNPHCPDLLQ